MSWDEISSTALLGTARRQLAPDAVPGEIRSLVDASSDPAVALLDVAAVATAYRRAGLALVPAREPLAPAAGDGRAVVPADARSRLSELLGIREADLLGQWLDAASDRGLAPPPAALPRLLDLAAGDLRLAAPVARAVGPRGAWLAAHRPHWRAALEVTADVVLDPAAVGRARERARGAVRVAEQVSVHPPAELDDAMRADGIPDLPRRARTGLGGWLVLHLVAAAPLDTWPADLLDRPIDDGWPETLWRGLARAAIRERDPVWAARLLPGEPPGGREPVLVDLLGAFPAPWPEPLAGAVLDLLATRAEDPFAVRAVLELAARRLPLTGAQTLMDIGRRWPPSAPARRAFLRAVKVMAYRRTMLEELE